MTFATSSFFILGYSVISPFLSIILTILVSTPNPAPSLVKSFATIKSRFFFFTLPLAFSIRSFVSAANHLYPSLSQALLLGSSTEDMYFDEQVSRGQKLWDNTARY